MQGVVWFEGLHVEGFAGVAHGGGEPGELAMREAVHVDGHEEGGDLGVGDFVGGGEVFVAEGVEGAFALEDYGVDEVLDFGLGEFFAVALFADDVDGMDGVRGHVCFDSLVGPGWGISRIA